MRDSRFWQYLSSDYRGLVSGRSLSRPAVRDAVSRCRRVEKTLNIDLDRYLDGRMESLKTLLGDIEEGTQRFDIDGDLRTGIASIKNAAKRYNDFKVWEARRR